MNVKKGIFMPLTEAGTKKEYDKRSHDERIEDLRTAFAELKVIARATGKKTDASAAKVLKEAKVNKSYFHDKKIKDEAVQKQYYNVRDDINQFQKNFTASDPDKKSALGKALLKAEEEEKNAISLERQLIQSREEVAGLNARINKVKDKKEASDNNLLDVTFKHLADASRNSGSTVNFTNTAYVSPDIYLKRNGVYCFDDDGLKKKAWARCEEELHKALNRNLPMRVYMLVGAPCAGKTDWANNSTSYWHDRHPVVIDATNLTRFDRIEWFTIINQYVRTNDIKTCVVVFDTPLDVLFSRNNVRELSKKMDDKVITEKFNRLQWPDLKEEKFDEMMVVKYVKTAS